MPAGQPLPALKYPAKFLPPNSGIPMNNPDASVTGAKTALPPPPTMPVEKLIQSMQPEQPMVVDSPSGGGGYGSSQSGSTSSTSAAPQ
jgi:pilus assembly protein CpaC